MGPPREGAASQSSTIPRSTSTQPPPTSKPAHGWSRPSPGAARRTTSPFRTGYPRSARAQPRRSVGHSMQVGLQPWAPTAPPYRTGIDSRSWITCTMMRRELVPGRRSRGPRPQRPLATPHPVRQGHPMVAAVLRDSGLGRRRNPRRRLSSRGRPELKPRRGNACSRIRTGSPPAICRPRSTSTSRRTPQRVKCSFEDCGSGSAARRAVTTQRPQRSTRCQGQSRASQRAIASARGRSRLDLSARTQDCTVTSQFSEAEGYR